MRCNARKWLVESYPKIAFQYLSTKNTSVDGQEFQMNVKHNEDLTRFLTSMLQTPEAAKVKKFWKHIKTHAQVLGINNTNTNSQDNMSKIKKNRLSMPVSTNDNGKIKILE